jgi:hypothetical protein
VCKKTRLVLSTVQQEDEHDDEHEHARRF